MNELNGVHDKLLQRVCEVETIPLIAVGLGALITLIVLSAAWRWRSGTRALYSRLEAARTPISPTRYDPRELAGLPWPVQRYFRAALTEGQPLVVAVSVTQTGAFNTKERGEQWKPFTSAQRSVTKRPGFVWDARIAMMPGVSVHVHDAYVAGTGVLHATLLGLFTLVRVRGTPESARGELMRFLAETPWYPTALLPSQGVRWEAVDDTSAKATLTDEGTPVTLLFRFNRAGLIDSAYAEARGRMVKDVVVPTPWEGRWRNYELRNGMRVPLDGEVEWLLREGPKPYWRGHITSVIYEFAR